jgi:RNA polymerase sigma factor (sigma-70 family)
MAERAAADALIEEYAWAPLAFVRQRYRLSPTASRFDDLVSAAQLGLLQAARRWEPTRAACSFKTFLWARMLGATRDELRANDHLTRAERRAVNAGGEEPRLATASLDADEIPSLAATADKTDALVLRTAYEQALAAITPRHRNVWLLTQAGFDGVEIGEALGCTASRISQIRTETKRRLRKALAA